MSEVYYCGKCKRQQEPKKGEKCIMCGRITVSWHTEKEGENAAKARWVSINGPV